MKKSLFTIIGILFSIHSFAQENERAGRKLLSEGNTFYDKGKYNESIERYQDAIRIAPENAYALYNLANTYYRTEKFEDAVSLYESYLAQISDENIKARGLHNMGNAFLMMNDLEKSIESYKNALKLNPGDEDTRYNLAYAQKKLKQQQQQKEKEKENENENKNKNEKEKEKEKENKENKDKENGNKDQKDQNNKNEQDKQQQDQDRKSDQQQNANGKMTRQQAEKLLNLLNSEEKQVQDAIRKRDKLNATAPATGKSW